MSDMLISTKNLYLQRSFTEETAARLKRLYGLAQEEQLLCAVWTGAVVRRGFVLSDKALRWRLLACDGTPCSGAVVKQECATVTFTLSAAVATEGAANTEAVSRLELRADDKSYVFFLKGLAEEKRATLCDILSFGYQQGVVPQADLSQLVKEPPLTALRSAIDGVCNDVSACIAKLQAKRKQRYSAQGATASTNADSSAQGFATQAEGSKAEQATAQEEEPRHAEAATAAPTSAASAHVKKQSPFLGGLVYVLDVIASMTFVLLCTFKLKGSELLANKSLLSLWFSYGILRFSVAVLTKNGLRNILSLLLAAVLASCNLWILGSLPHLMFFTFVLLVYLSLQYSYELPTKAVITKLCVVIVLGFFLYCYLHYEALAAFRKAVAELCAMLSLPQPLLSWGKLAASSAR